MRIKLIIGLIALTFMLVSPAVNALSVGSFRASNEKTIFGGETAQFTISYFNTGDGNAIINLKVETDLPVEYPNGQQITLEPVAITDNPENVGSWFHLEDGKYVKTESLSFAINTPKNQNSTHTIKAVSEIRPEDSAESEIYQSVAEVIEYIFYLNVKGNGTTEIFKNDTEINKTEIINSTKLASKPKNNQPSDNQPSTDDKQSFNAPESSTFKLTGNFVSGVNSIVAWTLVVIISVVVIILRSRF